MSRIILCLALSVFAYAIPPILEQDPQLVKTRKPKVDINTLIPLKLEPVEPDELIGAKSINLELASYPCEDGKNNVIRVDNAKAGLRIQIKDVEARTYTGDGKPSCYKARARLAIPGMIKVIKGTVVVSAPSNLKKSLEMRLTMKKDSVIVGTVCENGKRKSTVIQDGMCTQALNKDFPEEVYKLLSTPGTYDITAVFDAVGFATTFPIESIKSAARVVAEGDWQVQANFFSENQEIAVFKIPSNTDWVYIN